MIRSFLAFIRVIIMFFGFKFNPKIYLEDLQRVTRSIENANTIPKLILASTEMDEFQYTWILGPYDKDYDKLNIMLCDKMWRNHVQ